MEEMLIEGVNEGKPVTVEKINLEAMELLAPLKNLTKEEQMRSLRIFIMAALTSSNSIVIPPSDPRYKDRIELWARRMPAEDALKLSELFMKENESFLLAKGMHPHPKETSQPSDMPSV